MLSGKIPYRDLYEQKGLMLYALHVLAALLYQKKHIREILRMIGMIPSENGAHLSNRVRMKPMKHGENRCFLWEKSV